MASLSPKHKKVLVRILSYLYVFLGFAAIIFYISFYYRIVEKPEGWAVMLIIALVFFAGYVTLNHKFINRVISRELLIKVEVLLFVAILTLIFSDLMFDQLHLNRR